MIVWIYLKDNRGKRIEVPNATNVEDALNKAKQQLSKEDQQQIDNCLVEEDFI